MRLNAIWLLVIFGLGLLVAPLVVEAQQPGKVYRIGFLEADSPPSEPDWQSFWQGMRELGWIEGQNMVS